MVISNKVVKNASWLVACRVFQSLLTFVITMLTARYLKPANFGIISYAASLVAFVVPIMQLGFSNVLVQELTAHPEEEGKILGSSIILSTISACFCIAGITVFAKVANPDEPSTVIICLLYSTLLIFQAVELIQYWFQAKLKSKYFSVVSLLAYTVVALYEFYLLATAKDVFYFSVTKSIQFLLLSVSLIVIYLKNGGQKLAFSASTAKRIFNSSRYYIVSSLMVTIFAQTDRIMIKHMIDDAATGLYTAAATCAGVTQFVFAAIIDSMRPVIFARKHQNDEDGYKNSLKLLYSIIIALSLAQCIVITVFAGLIISVLYGSDYVAAIPTLQISVWFTTFSYLGSVRNIWILAEQKQKYLWIINLCGAVANVVMNYFLIPVWGINGAALASLLTQFFTNVVIGFIIRPIRPNNQLMIESLNPKLLVGAVKETLHSRKK